MFIFITFMKSDALLCQIIYVYTLMFKIIFTYPKMLIFNEIFNQCDPYLQGMWENQAYLALSNQK